MIKKLVGYVVNHGHMDIEWYMPLRSYRFWTVEVLDELQRIAKEHPDYVTYVLDGVTYVNHRWKTDNWTILHSV